MRQSLRNICTSLELKTGRYEINTDFKIWIEIEHLLFDTSKACEQRLAEILVLAYPVLPTLLSEAIEGILWFYSAGDMGDSAADEKKSIVPYYDLSEDFDYVWGAFKGEFGIDITEADMHWWKFRVLLGCLSDECRFSKIIGYRTMDTSKIKNREERLFYERMKKQFSLKARSTPEAREIQLAESLESIF